MLKQEHGELPTSDYKNINRAAKLELFNHYLNHKINSSKTVLENIICSFNNQYRPEKYYFRSSNNLKTNDDSLKDIRSLAHLAVWEATDKYLLGASKKNQIEYKEKFNFCVFASEQVKFKLRTHLRLLNINRICGKLPDSDSIRNIYSKLPKIKLDKKNLQEKDYKIIAVDNNLDIKDIRLVDEFITIKTESGDANIKNDDGEDAGNKWDQLEKGNNNLIKSNKEIEETIEKKIIAQNFNELRKKFLLSLSIRDREILNNTKLIEFNSSNNLSLKELGKKFNLSAERIRQISEKKFSDFKKILINNKKKLGEE